MYQYTNEIKEETPDFVRRFFFYFIGILVHRYITTLLRLLKILHRLY